jgi:DNA-binding NtrC family response regulator
MSRILIVEDEAVIRSELRRLLTRHGHGVVEVATVAEARAQAPDAFDLVICDLRLPEESGTALIPDAGDTPILIMTAFATVKSAVEAMKDGAADYISKPFDPDEMLLLVDRLTAQRRRERRTAALEKDVEASWEVGGMVARCGPMLEVLDRLERVAPTDATVLILGESGTGKELVARAIHDKSRRQDGAFVAVNCAAIPEGLIESELFGHEKGAFTGAVDKRGGLVEAASGGTLFLDEVGELPAAAQARLLRVLQESEIRLVGSSDTRKVDVRVIAATHRDLPAMVREKTFREDLYFRLRVVDIRLPPLRERGEDLLALAEHLLEKTCKRLGRGPARLSEAASRAIRAYPWPGNVRELENAIERAVILADGDTIEPPGLGIEPEAAPGAAPAPKAEAMEVSLDEYFRQFVEAHQGELSETEIAKRLGISRKALWERRRRFGIPRPK